MAPSNNPACFCGKCPPRPSGAGQPPAAPFFSTWVVLARKKGTDDPLAFWPQQAVGGQSEAEAQGIVDLHTFRAGFAEVTHDLRAVRLEDCEELAETAAKLASEVITLAAERTLDLKAMQLASYTLATQQQEIARLKARIAQLESASAQPSPATPGVH